MSTYVIADKLKTPNVNNPIPSIECYKHTGVNRSRMNYVMINNPVIHSKLERSLLQEYFLLYWQGSYFTHMMKDGCITVGGKIYDVVYKDVTPAIAKKSRQLKLSFREAHEIFDLPAYVLVMNAEV